MQGKQFQVILNQYGIRKLKDGAAEELAPMSVTKIIHLSTFAKIAGKPSMAGEIKFC